MRKGLIIGLCVFLVFVSVFGVTSFYGFGNKITDLTNKIEDTWLYRKIASFFEDIVVEETVDVYTLKYGDVTLTCELFSVTNDSIFDTGRKIGFRVTDSNSPDFVVGTLILPNDDLTYIVRSPVGKETLILRSLLKTQNNSDPSDDQESPVIKDVPPDGLEYTHVLKIKGKPKIYCTYRLVTEGSFPNQIRKGVYSVEYSYVDNIPIGSEISSYDALQYVVKIPDSGSSIFDSDMKLLKSQCLITNRVETPNKVFKFHAPLSGEIVYLNCYYGPEEFGDAVFCYYVCSSEDQFYPIGTKFEFVGLGGTEYFIYLPDGSSLSLSPNDIIAIEDYIGE